tara:strand:+ start:57 stop:203 length:147 start_codon:yes stop_codon:yes gene_type:complete
MSNLIAIGNYIGVKLPGARSPGLQDIVTELSAQIVTEDSTSNQNVITE